VLGPGSTIAAIAIAVIYLPILARVMRTSTMIVSRNDYVAGSRARGAGHLRVITTHVAPNVLGPVVVQASVLSAFALQLEAARGHLERDNDGRALAIVDQSQPGDWDVMVIDTVDVRRGVDRGLFEPLPDDKLPIADIFPEVLMDSHAVVDGKRYGITEKFGYNTIGFNKSKVDPADMDDLSVIWSDKYKGRIALYDYYLPMVGLTGVGIGKKTADLTQDDLPAIKEKLFEMKKVSRQVSDVVASQTALATGEVDIVVGGGEWLTAGLTAEKPNLDWTIPKQGALRWAQSIGVFKDSAKQDLALKFVQYIVSPEGQARLATSSCYWAMPSNAKAGEHLTDQQKTALRWDKQPEYLKNSQLYPVADADMDAAMQDVWTEMLQQ